jgi:hypothetical protein
MFNVIKFVTNRFWQTTDTSTKPISASKTLPDWYTKGDRFFKIPNTEDHYVGEDGGKIPTWKSCMPFMDVMMSGYVMRTPCDIEFYLNENSKISCKINDQKNKEFCSERTPMSQFYQPDGYYLDHFAWWVDWGIELPEGYSAIYTSPFNRFDLPFINASGIIDNDVVNIMGNVPFFIREGWTGIVSKGTPFIQIFPFKREDWKSETIVEDPYKLYDKNMTNSAKYRVPDGGVYKNVDWHRRSYE